MDIKSIGDARVTQLNHSVHWLEAASHTNFADTFSEAADVGYNVQCSGSMIPDTNVGGNITTINEVSDDQ
ncbi:hypothetical protein NLU14_21100, partial [Marinobacter sp. 71-i]